MKTLITLLLLFHSLTPLRLQTPPETADQRQVERIADKLLNHILSRKFHQNEYFELKEGLSDMTDSVDRQNTLYTNHQSNNSRAISQLHKYYEYF